jgi:hypothetical protein
MINAHNTNYGFYNNVVGTDDVGNILTGIYSEITNGTGRNSIITGISGIATGGGGNPSSGYGVYGSASGSHTNYAGYFEDGDVYTKNNLIVGGTCELEDTVTISKDVDDAEFEANILYNNNDIGNGESNSVSQIFRLRESTNMGTSWTDADAVTLTAKYWGGTQDGYGGSDIVVSTGLVITTLKNNVPVYGNILMDSATGFQLRFGSDLTSSEGVTFTTANFRPITDNTLSLGNTTYRWNGIYSDDFNCDGALVDPSVANAVVYTREGIRGEGSTSDNYEWDVLLPTIDPTADIATKLLYSKYPETGAAVQKTSGIPIGIMCDTFHVRHDEMWDSESSESAKIVATFDARTLFFNPILIITEQSVYPSGTLDISLGFDGGTYIDCIVASDAKAAANTIYGDDDAEVGTDFPDGADNMGRMFLAAADALYVYVNGSADDLTEANYTAGEYDICLCWLTLPTTTGEGFAH